MPRNPSPAAFAFSLALIAASTLAPAPARAADDPTIPTEVREEIRTAMERFIHRNTVDGRYWIYDPVANRLTRLRFQELHEGIVSRGGVYVSCADFVDETGRVYDLDFLVLPDGESFTAIQAVVHGVDGEKRKYHLEE